MNKDTVFFCGDQGATENIFTQADDWKEMQNYEIRDLNSSS